VTQHKIDALRSGTTPRGEDFEEEYTITFTFTPAGGDNWHEPSYGETVEFQRVDPPVATDGSVPHADLLQRQVNQWAEDWLDDHYDEACAAAYHDNLYDREDRADYEREARIDDALMEKAFIK
jgi:hypothetical protein